MLKKWQTCSGTTSDMPASSRRHAELHSDSPWPRCRFPDAATGCHCLHRWPGSPWSACWHTSCPETNPWACIVCSSHRACKRPALGERWRESGINYLIIFLLYHTHHPNTWRVSCRPNSLAASDYVVPGKRCPRSAADTRSARADSHSRRTRLGSRISTRVYKATDTAVKKGHQSIKWTICVQFSNDFDHNARPLKRCKGIGGMADWDWDWRTSFWVRPKYLASA